MTPTQHRLSLLKKTALARAEALSLLASLRAAKEQSELRLASLNMTDSIKRVTGRSSLDRAIASTERMLETLERSRQQLERSLDAPPDAPGSVKLPGSVSTSQQPSQRTAEVSYPAQLPEASGVPSVDT